MIEISFCLMQIYTFAAEKSNLFLMSKEIRLKKGLNIHLLGDADKVYASTKPTEKYVVKPTDFHGLMPKLCVKVGDKLKAGTPLFYDKYNEKINFCSPISGAVTDIVRGEKRKINLAGNGRPGFSKSRTFEAEEQFSRKQSAWLLEKSDF